MEGPRDANKGDYHTPQPTIFPSEFALTPSNRTTGRLLVEGMDRGRRVNIKPSMHKET